MVTLRILGALLTLAAIAAWTGPCGDLLSGFTFSCVQHEGPHETLVARHEYMTLTAQYYTQSEMPLESLYAIAFSNAEDACCSGGANGGTDATGNECTNSEAITVVAAAN